MLALHPMPRCSRLVHVSLGRGNSLENRRRRCRPGHEIRAAVQMAAHNQDPFAAIGVSDSHKQEAAALVSQGLKPTRHVEANQLLYSIGAVAGYRCTVWSIGNPAPSACDIVRFPRIEGAVPCNRDP
jgi:hypothetical protein